MLETQIQSFVEKVFIPRSNSLKSARNRVSLLEYIKDIDISHLSCGTEMKGKWNWNVNGKFSIKCKDLFQKNSKYKD